jgi:hypothetical protein
MPLAELQSEWVADYLIGEYALPADAEMQQAISKDRDAMRKRYGSAPRHTMQVDFAPYVSLVKKERTRGAARARKLNREKQPEIAAVAKGHAGS